MMLSEVLLNVSTDMAIHVIHACSSLVGIIQWKCLLLKSVSVCHMNLGNCVRICSEEKMVSRVSTTNGLNPANQEELHSSLTLYTSLDLMILPLHFNKINVTENSL